MKGDPPFLVDEKSYDLAEHFLHGEGEEDDVWNLAHAIQEAVEDWFDRREKTDEAERGDVRS